MKLVANRILVPMLAIPLIAGCRATRALTCACAEAIVDGFFDTDKTYSEKLENQAASERWKRFWRENPSANPKMTEAYVNE